MSRWIFVAALASASCGASTQSLTADTTDYELYRRTRTATTSEGRLSASFEYLEREPDGRWNAEVKAWFNRAEPLYYEASSASAPGLEAYMSALPRGPHVKLAAERLLEIRAGARMARERDSELLDEALGVEQKLADADEMRRAVVREIRDWSNRLATIPSFGMPTSELPHETIHHFRVLEPVATCADERCSKALSLPYAIPDGKRLSPRKVRVRRGADAGSGQRRQRAAARPRASGAGSTSATTNGRFVPTMPKPEPKPSPGRCRSSSRRWAPSFAGAECQREAVSPVVLERECRGVRVQMQAAPTPESDDELRVEPTTKHGP